MVRGIGVQFENPGGSFAEHERAGPDGPVIHVRGGVRNVLEDVCRVDPDPRRLRQPVGEDGVRVAEREDRRVGVGALDRFNVREDEGHGEVVGLHVVVRELHVLAGAGHAVVPGRVAHEGKRPYLAAFRRDPGRREPPLVFAGPSLGHEAFVDERPGLRPFLEHDVAGYEARWGIDREDHVAGEGGRCRRGR